MSITRNMVRSKPFLRRILILSAALAIFSGCAKKNQAGAAKPAPQKIVSLSPTSTEILFAVGAGRQIAACSDLSDYPPEAKELPSVGGFDGKTLSLERILSFQPDFVYLTDVMHNHFIPDLEKYGIQYYVSKGASIDDVKNEILEIAELTGHKVRGQELVAGIDADLDKAASAKVERIVLTDAGSQDGAQETGTPAVYWEVWSSPYMSAGRESFINDVIKAAGGQNIFEDISTAYPVVSEETIILRQPDVMLIPQSSGIDKSSVAARPGWETIPAVQTGRVFVVDDNLLTRAGPRIGQSVLLLAGLLH